MAVTSERGKASIKRAAQRVKDARASGYRTTSRYTEDVQSGKIKAINQSVIPSGTITAESLKPAPKINLPTPPAVDGLFGTTDAINAGLASLSGGTYDAASKQIVPAPAQTGTESPDKYTQLFQSYMGNQAGNVMPSYTDAVKEQQKMLRPQEQRVNSLQNQLNTITTARDSQMMRLEGQGRGQTQSFIGGEQARVSREAAIAALPVQAQLAAAQSDLESARTYAGQYFQAKMQDAQNMYNYKKDLNNSIFAFLTADEQRKQAANEKQLDREYAEKQAATTNAQNIAMQAIEYGQSSLAGRIMGLDPKSPTYAQDVRNAMGELRKPVAPKAAVAPKAPEIQNFGTSDNPMWKQYDFSTGTWKDVGGVTGQSSVAQAKKDAEKADSIALQIKTIGDLKQHSGLNSAVGPNAMSRIALADSFGAKDDFIGGVEQLISQKFIDELVSAKAKGATFGALTKPEQDALTAAASKIGQWRVREGNTENGRVIGYDIDEANFKKELDILITAAQKVESATRGYDVSLIPQQDSAAIDAMFRQSLLQSAMPLTFSPANYY